MSARKIKTKPDPGLTANGLTIGGWLHGRNTYLWLGDKNENFCGTIGGVKLYRLAKAIVRQWEPK